MQKVSFPVCKWKLITNTKTGNRIAERLKFFVLHKEMQDKVYKWRKVRQPQRCSRRHIFLLKRRRTPWGSLRAKMRARQDFPTSAVFSSSPEYQDNSIRHISWVISQMWKTLHQMEDLTTDGHEHSAPGLLEPEADKGLWHHPIPLPQNCAQADYTPCNSPSSTAITWLLRNTWGGG